MNFAKGAILGMVAGAIVGAINSDSFMGMFDKSKKELIKMKRRYGA
ncbi:MAG: hypothetical protein RSE00_00295 [Clostridia bacterium]